MKLKDIVDMETYLEERCYCPGEIYDLTGFFFQVFKPDTPCELLISGCRRAINGTFVIASASELVKPQIIYIEHDDGYVGSCVRFDATERNKDQVLKFMHGEIDSMMFDEYEDSRTEEALNEVLSVADAIMVK